MKKGKNKRLIFKTWSLGPLEKRVNIINLRRLLALGEKAKKRLFFPLEGQKALYMTLKGLVLVQIVSIMGL